MWQFRDNICSPTQRGVERKWSLLRQVPRVPGSHTSCGEGSTLALTHFFFLSTRSKQAFLPSWCFIDFICWGRRQAFHIDVTNIGAECHLLVALRAVSQAEGAERFQRSRGSYETGKFREQLSSLELHLV